MLLKHDSINLTSTYLYSQDPMAVTSMMPTCLTPFRNVFQIGAIPTSLQTPWQKTSMTFLSTMESSNSKNQRESQKPAIRTMVSHNSNPPEIRINTAKETKTNAMETIITMKSPFAPTISSTDIQMLNVMTLAIQKEWMLTMPTTPIAMIRTTIVTATTTNKIATTKTTKTIETTSNTTTIIWHALSSKGKKITNNKKLLTTTANTWPTIPSLMMKSLPERKAQQQQQGSKHHHQTRLHTRDCYWCTSQCHYKMIQVPPSSDRLRIQLLDYLWILHAWPSQEENQRQSFRRNKMDNQEWNLCYYRRSKHLVPTHWICPKLPIQTQVQSRLRCQEHILWHHFWMWHNERTPIWSPLQWKHT